MLHSIGRVRPNKPGCSRNAEGRDSRHVIASCQHCTFTQTHPTMINHLSSYLYIGYTMKPRDLWDLDTCGNLYKHPRAKRKGVYIGFQGDLNPVGPEGFIV